MSAKTKHFDTWYDPPDNEKTPPTDPASEAASERRRIEDIVQYWLDSAAQAIANGRLDDCPQEKYGFQCRQALASTILSAIRQPEIASAPPSPPVPTAAEELTEEDVRIWEQAKAEGRGKVKFKTLPTAADVEQRSRRFVVCRKCGKRPDELRQKYCGDGSDKDNPHQWEFPEAEEYCKNLASNLRPLCIGAFAAGAKFGARSEAERREAEVALQRKIQSELVKENNQLTADRDRLTRELAAARQAMTEVQKATAHAAGLTKTEMSRSGNFDGINHGMDLAEINGIAAAALATAGREG